MKNPIITLLTDYGTKDHYVASMKGVILNINPRCTVIDITHQVNPHDIEEGAFVLANAFFSFPRGTIHLSVVDPGVGGPRKPVLFVTTNYFFIGPDNGLFTFVLKRDKVKKVVALTNPKFFLSSMSTTFHGRDLFAPVAAHLSLGVKPEAFGPPVNSWVDLDFERSRVEGGKLWGEIIHIDTFGNVVTNITEEELTDFARGHVLVILVGKRRIHGLKKGYWEARRGEPLAVIGSGGFLEISVREGNAQKMLKVKKRDRVIIQVSG